ncbi:DEKNAAC101024 [Brettanomyces naardenensis]|uniref:mRNA export factor GLE1 n=1 Tax=Brettanomyces naardenensis TaxID=13370 RepID=A0A448YGN3_BRENA|nr:DEKNAAC101024 [Brettanomyces naardenensis]
MRFCPHRDESLQYSFEKIDSDYDSLTEDEFLDEEESGASSQTTVRGEDKEVEEMGKFLDGMKLNDRFRLITEMTEVSNELRTERVVPKLLEGKEGEDKGKKEGQRKEEENEEEEIDLARDGMKHGGLVPGRIYQEGYDAIKGMISRRIRKKANQVEELIREEEERKTREEERRRREEEERKRKEEEERKRKEEVERKKKEEEIRLETERKNKEEEMRRKIEESRLAKKKAEEEAKKKEEARAKGTTDFVKVEREFLGYKKIIEEIKKNIVEPMKEDKELKKIVGAQKRKINAKFGQLTRSRSQLERITRELQGLIAETKSNESAYKWILNFVAKAIIHQAEAEVGVKPYAGVPLGCLSLDLLLLFPDLKYYLMARFVKKCPMLIGYSCSIDTEEGRVRMGWRRADDNRWEDEARYCERLGGICTLYSVITRLQISQSYLGYTAQTEHPLPISRSWIMLSRLLNTPLKLVSNIHFVIAGSWWDACGSKFLEAYGKQAEKLMQLLWNNWTSAVSEKRYPGAARLRLLGEDWRGGKLEGLKGMEN